jgi:hypothetical protein
MKKNPKDSKILSKKKKKKPMQWCSKSNEENKNKEKEPKPNTGGAPWTILQIKSKVHKCMNKKFGI